MVKITIKSAHKILRSSKLESVPNADNRCYHFRNTTLGYNPLMIRLCGKALDGTKVLGTERYKVFDEVKARYWVFLPQWIDKVEQLNEGGT